MRTSWNPNMFSFFGFCFIFFIKRLILNIMSAHTNNSLTKDTNKSLAYQVVFYLLITESIYWFHCKAFKNDDD
jgi:hypothetical protein